MIKHMWPFNAEWVQDDVTLHSVRAGDQRHQSVRPVPGARRWSRAAQAFASLTGSFIYVSSDM